MSDQAAATATPAPGAAPAKPRIIAQREGQPASAKGSVDAIVDSVFEEGLPDDIKALEGLDIGAEDGGPDLTNLEVEDDDGGDEGEADPGEESAGDEEAPPERERKTTDRSVGSEDNPYTVKTLPADKFVKLKVDGEETVVPMKELADGYIRQQTFNKRLNHADSLAEQATEIAHTAVNERNELRKNFREVMGDPETLFGYLLDNHMDTLRDVSTAYAKLHAQWAKDPASKRQWDLERREAKLRDQETRDGKRRETEESERRASAETARVRAQLEPAYQEGLKLAGFPKITPELRETFKIICEQRRRVTGAALTPDDVKNAVVRAAKLVKTETVSDRKPPPPAESAKKKPPTAKSGKGAEKLNKDDPDYWIKGVKVTRRG